jgi:hypothetical protein
MAGPGEVVVEIVRLLDMPVQEKMLSNDFKQYRVRAFHGNDEKSMQEIGKTKELAGVSEGFLEGVGVKTETLRLGPEGIFRARTDSPMIHLLVEYAGGFYGNHKIGRCRIARSDPRSNQIWPYQLNDKSGQPVGCGIELKVHEGGGEVLQSAPGIPASPHGGTPFAAPDALWSEPLQPSFHTVPPQPLQPSFHTVPPLGPDGHTIPPLHGVPPLDLVGLQGSVPGSAMPNTLRSPSQSSRSNTPPLSPSFPPEFQPSFQTTPRQAPPQVKEATFRGQNVTLLVNQLIQMNGIEDPTKGASIEQLFGGPGDLKVRTKYRTIVVNSNREPPYDLRPLFVPSLPSTSSELRGHAAIPNVVMLLEIDRIVDIPAPVYSSNHEVMLVLERADCRRPIARAGPFQTEPSGHLLNVESCHGSKLVARATMDDLIQGALQVCVAVYYGPQQRVGSSVPISVTWKPEPLQYIPLVLDDKEMATYTYVGGIYLAFRLIDAAGAESMQHSTMSRKPPGVPSPRAAPDSKPSNHQSGKFKPRSLDHIKEAAAFAVEAQNRALVQRCNLATTATEMSESKKDDNGLAWRLPSGCRDWKDLDSVFITLGPNYVAQSDEVGAQICRVYTERTSVLSEVESSFDSMGLHPPANMKEEGMNEAFVNNMFPLVDATKQLATLRPVICKDAGAVQRAGLQRPHMKPVLKVKVLSATNLRSEHHLASDADGGSGGFKVIVEIVGKKSCKWETHHCADGRHAHWNEEGLIKGYDYGDDLKVTIADSSWTVFNSSHLGEARIDGSDFYPGPYFAKVPLVNADTARANRSAQIVLEVSVLDAHEQHQSWPPYPPQYAPVTNLCESDQLTQRLANWDIHQNAKLPFADVTSNYRMNEDVWAAFQSEKAIGEMGLGPPAGEHKRVKDDCLMA